ncbi:hypothetical protein BX661DRAFT_83627 [Kickxella alabastrina]|uniref:uncharacterized protein n=1 Tax=Kickxella alabastrina TaxID=61397 RepID=UPI00221FA337|nr:uncharacterized protein BX661DRAFT_83627 [Kickxella alabastrina]KAI7819737.1 hypothetical protein BX661DRAFT_83627 [Kickxella alabastrina]
MTLVTLCRCYCSHSGIHPVSPYMVFYLQCSLLLALSRGDCQVLLLLSLFSVLFLFYHLVLGLFASFFLSAHLLHLRIFCPSVVLFIFFFFLSSDSCRCCVDCMSTVVFIFLYSKNPSIYF